MVTCLDFQIETQVKQKIAVGKEDDCLPNSISHTPSNNSALFKLCIRARTLLMTKKKQMKMVMNRATRNPAPKYCSNYLAATRFM